MLNAILGTKKSMTQTWTKDGKRVPVTVAQAGPVVVTQIKSKEKDGYIAVQLGLGEKKIKNITKPILGHLKGVIKEKKAPLFLRETKFVREVPGVGDQVQLKVGDVIKASDVLSPGDIVQVRGISKGKGFQGVVKRWGFAGGPRTHGQSDRERAPGSIGQTTTPGRVLRGKKMAGRMGGEKVTVKNLTILEVTGGGVVKLSGPVPGSAGDLIFIEKIGHDDKFKNLTGSEQEENTQGELG